MRTSLSAILSELVRILESHEEAAGYDAGFDGGEFSGPSHWQSAGAEMLAALQAGGWKSAEELREETEARTSVRYVFFSELGAAFACLEEAEGRHAYSRRIGLIPQKKAPRRR